MTQDNNDKSSQEASDEPSQKIPNEPPQETPDEPPQETPNEPPQETPDEPPQVVLLELSQVALRELSQVVKILNTQSFVTTLAGLIGVASLLYAFGFVIVNIYLESKGIRDFGLTKPTYISAGTAFVVQTSFLVLVTYFAIDRIANFRKKTINRKAVGKVTLIIIVISVLGLYFYNTLEQERVLGLFPRYIGSVLLVTILISILMQLFIKFPIRGDSIVWGLGGILIILVFFVFSILWGRQVYPNLLPQFGGGLPVRVQLIIQQEMGQTLFKEAKIEFESDYRTRELDLIDLTDKALIVENLSSKRVIKINRDLIAGIIFLSKDGLTVVNIVELTVSPTPTSTSTLAPTPTSTPTLTPTSTSTSTLTPTPTSTPTLTPTPLPTLKPTPISTPPHLPGTGLGVTLSFPPVISSLTVIGLLVKGFCSVKKRPIGFIGDSG